MPICTTACPILPDGRGYFSEVTENNLAVRVGFEPTEPVKVQRFSRPPDSTALAPHHFRILPFPNNLDQPSLCRFLHRTGYCHYFVTTISPEAEPREFWHRDSSAALSPLQDRRQPASAATRTYAGR